MTNIIDYARQEKRSFTELPLNIVDSLIFSQLAYVYFGAAVANLEDDRVSFLIKDFDSALPNFEKIFTNVLSGEKSRELLLALATNPRFQNLRLNYYVEELDKKLQKQFSAVSYLINKNLTYVAFRGTDNTLIGWKEDFNMTYLSPTPSQKEALTYLKKVARKTTGELLVGGHSKGGNLAVYAAMMSDRHIKKRISTVYSHDGPGLNNNWWGRFKFKLIEKKINKTIAASSLVGVLLETTNRYKIVKSKRHSLMQHDPFSWMVKENDFVYLSKLARTAQRLEKTLPKWLAGLPNRKREIFVNTFYQIITDNGVEKVEELIKMKPADLLKILQKFQNLDEETKEFIKNTLIKLLKISLKEKL